VRNAWHHLDNETKQDASPGLVDDDIADFGKNVGSLILLATQQPDGAPWWAWWPRYDHVHIHQCRNIEAEQIPRHWANAKLCSHISAMNCNQCRY